VCVCVTYRNVTRDTLLRQGALPIVWGGGGGTSHCLGGGGGGVCNLPIEKC
jgi:hypothetical protein